MRGFFATLRMTKVRVGGERKSNRKNNRRSLDCVAHKVARATSLRMTKVLDEEQVVARATATTTAKAKCGGSSLRSE
jgi:hypothetical protein